MRPSIYFRAQNEFARDSAILDLIKLMNMSADAGCLRKFMQGALTTDPPLNQDEHLHGPLIMKIYTPFDIEFPAPNASQLLQGYLVGLLPNLFLHLLNFFLWVHDVLSGEI